MDPRAAILPRTLDRVPGAARLDAPNPGGDRVLSLLHVPGDPPLVLRIGGDSSSEALWEPDLGDVPDWVVALTPEWLAGTTALVRHTGVGLILDLNQVTACLRCGAQWAEPPKRRCRGGASSASKSATSPTFTVAGSGSESSRGRSPPSNASRFALSLRLRQGLRAYAHAVAAVSAPGVALLGPAVANPRPTSTGFRPSSPVPTRACAR